MAKTALDELTPTVRTCCLLQLPAEIRNKIYAYAVTTEPPICIDPYGSVIVRSHFSGLLYIRGQIGAGSRDVFYNANTFRFEIEPGIVQSTSPSSPTTKNRLRG